MTSWLPCFLLMVPPSIFGEKEFCNIQEDICATFDDDFNTIEMAAIDAWWSEMEAEMKPMKKCEFAMAAESDLVEFRQPQNSLPALESYRCYQGEKATQFYYRGTIRNETFFEGAGKFGHGVRDANPELAGICVSLGRLTQGNFEVRNVTGNFKDGRPHGLARADLENNYTVVANFRHGYVHGFYRIWDDRRDLVGVGVVHNGQRKLAWQRRGNILTFSHDDDAKALVMNLPHGPAVAGEQNDDTLVVADAQFARLTSVDSWSGCILIPTWRTEDDKKLLFSKVTGDIIYPGLELSQDASVCPDKGTAVWNQRNPAAELQRWYASLDHLLQDPTFSMDALSEPLSLDAEILIKIEPKKPGGKDGTLKATMMSGTAVKVAVEYGLFDEEGHLHGTVKLRIVGPGPMFPILQADVTAVSGFMDHGVLQGPAVVLLRNKINVAVKIKNGVIHGIVHSKPIRFTFPFAHEYHIDDINDPNFGSHGVHVGLIATFKNGRPNGIAWKGLMGGGFLYGNLSPESVDFSGEHVAFIYPDFETAIVGKFEENTLKSGRTVQVMEERCNAFGIKEVIFSHPDLMQTPLYYSPPSNISFGEGMTGTQDPYELKYVRVGLSTAGENSGEGVFAIRDIPKHRVACFYTGFAYRNDEEKFIYRRRYTDNVSLSEADRVWSKKYTLSTHVGGEIQIPIEHDSVGKWHPSFGPKVNTAFGADEINGQYEDFEHPVYGLISSVFTMRPIAKGQEIFVDYGYSCRENARSENAQRYFKWYYDLKEEYDKKKMAKKRTKKKSKTAAKKNN